MILWLADTLVTKGNAEFVNKSSHLAPNVLM